MISSHTAAADPASPHLVALSSVHVALVHLHVSALEEARSLLLGCRPHVSSLASTTLLRLEGVRGSLPAASEGGRRICSTWSCGQLCTRTEVHNTVHLTIALSWKICIYTHTHTHRLHTHTHRLHTHTGYTHTGFPGGTVVKNLPANARDTRDLGSIPGSGRSPGGGNGYPPSLLAWKIPLTEEPGGLQSMGLRRVGHD